MRTKEYFDIMKTRVNLKYTLQFKKNGKINEIKYMYLWVERDHKKLSEILHSCMKQHLKQLITKKYTRSSTKL